MERKHIQIRIRGDVRGVFFRVSAREKAQELGVTGAAQNEPDGSLVIEAEGEQESLDAFIAWCRIGPRRAHVQRVETEDGVMQDYSGFFIM